MCFYGTKLKWFDCGSGAELHAERVGVEESRREAISGNVCVSVISAIGFECFVVVNAVGSREESDSEFGNEFRSEFVREFASGFASESVSESANEFVREFASEFGSE